MTEIELGSVFLFHEQIGTKVEAGSKWVVIAIDRKRDMNYVLLRIGKRGKPLTIRHSNNMVTFTKKELRVMSDEGYAEMVEQWLKESLAKDVKRMLR